MKEALTDHERSLIERYGNFYRSLISGKRKPATPEQVRFIEAFHGRATPTNEHELAFVKYARIVRAERETEAVQRAAEWQAKAYEVEPAPGERSYPSSMDAKLDEAAEWASRNGFRGV